jgi:hypothetical protein
MHPRLILFEIILTTSLLASSALADEPEVARAAIAPSSPEAVAPPSDATLLVELDDPSVQVLLDGLPLAIVGLRGSFRITPGHHLVEARKDGLPPQRRPIDALAGETSGAVFHMVPWNTAAIGYDVPAHEPDHYRARDPDRGPLLLAGAVLAVAGLGLGVGLNLAANGKANEAHAEQAAIASGGGTTSTCSAPSAALAPTCSALRGSLTARDLEANVAAGSYVAGGIVAVATVAYWVWPAIERSLEPEGHHHWSGMASLTPSIDPRGGGFAITGVF